MSDSALTHDWYEVTQPSPGVFALLEPLQVEAVLSYLIVGNNRALLIDSGTGGASMKRTIDTLTDKPLLLLNSHAHWDHIGSNHEFAEVAIHADEVELLGEVMPAERIARWFGPGALLGDLPDGRSLESIRIGGTSPTQILQGDETFDLGGRTIRAMHTPGHSPGLLSLFDEQNGVLFTTDTAYPGPLYAFRNWRDIPVYIESLSRLADLTSSVRWCHPSHHADLMDPQLLPKMRDALTEILQGRRPEAVNDWKATHNYEGFGVYAPLGEPDN